MTQLHQTELINTFNLGSVCTLKVAAFINRSSKILKTNLQLSKWYVLWKKF